MTTSKGYYAAIQVSPDPTRLETVNIGAVLFCPEKRFLRAQFASDFRRAKKLFGSVDEALLEMQRDAIGARLGNASEFGRLEDLQDFIDRRGGALRFSVVRPMQVADPEDELAELFQRLVGPQEPTRRRGPRAKTLLTSILRKEHLFEQVHRPIKQKLPDIGTTFEADFGYRNGRFNVIAPVDFSSADGWFKAASARAVEGQALHGTEHPEHGRMTLVVVGRFARETERHSGAVRQILSDHQVRLYDLDRVEPLLADIRKHVAPMN